MENKKGFTKEEAQTTNDLSSKKHEIHYSFIRTILTISVSLLGIIVGLSGSILEHLTTYNYYTKGAFALAICTLSLGIVSLSISLYSFVSSRDRLLYNHLQRILDRIEGRQANKIISSSDGSDSADIYTIIHWVGCASLILSVLSFSSYLLFVLFP